MSKKKSFVLYNDYLKHISLLSDEEAGRLFRALFQFSEDKTNPQFDGALGMAFSFISEQISRDSEKYAATCQRRSEAGRMGGLKAQSSKHKQMLVNEAENESVNDSVTESETVMTQPDFTGIFSDVVEGNER